VIGLGQRFGGDDAVGLAVLARLAELGGGEELEQVEVEDATQLIEALLTPRRAVIVDAVLGAGEPGRVHLLSPDALARGALSAVSTHGLDVAQAIALARRLYPDTVSPRIQLVGVEIARAERFQQGLSPALAAAVDRAAEAVIALSHEAPCAAGDALLLSAPRAGDRR
jgi:hydrogenase maturation protease